MIKSKYNIIGVMSGTSLDGLDVAYIEFCYNASWSFKIIKAETIDYPKEWKSILKNLVSNSLEELQEIDKKYTSYLAFTINDFIRQNSIRNLDAICSHGHTALHQPENGLTYQIGNQEGICKLIGKTVVCDFRIQDVKLGGQGAPLVPIGDQLLFHDYDFCVNLGGFANISYQVGGSRIAYDICPVNIVLNYYVKKLGLRYDDKGSLASKGQLNRELLDQLNKLEYYKEKAPKSLGLEWVISKVFPLIDSFGLEIKDILRTFIEHTAIQINNELNQKTNASVLFTGGGVYNSFLMKRISHFSFNKITKPSDEIIEYKEALIFGLLGVLKLRGENNCLSSVTGAKHNHSSGNIFIP
ncbi:anhydro-N-acetylmuramic acid kinase [Pontimicrobium sp. SW4]|uniref:Anhydro-N-acetylmuramic acid kinase n=1 Tax=Pontimicrobium sp. SW4 TaxID=3153519 RepID=A0AAU7BUB7_9FLAO